MGFYQDCREVINKGDLKGILSIPDKVLYNIMFNSNQGGYCTSWFDRVAMVDGTQDKLMKILKNFDVDLNLNYVREFRWEHDWFLKEDFSNDVFDTLFGERFFYSTYELCNPTPTAFAKFCIKNQIHFKVFGSLYDNRECATEEENKLADDFWKLVEFLPHSSGDPCPDRNIKYVNLSDIDRLVGQGIIK